MSSIVDVRCAEIQSSVGFVYEILLKHDGDCEQGWYSEDGRLIANPADPQELIDPAASVSSDGLVTSDCVNVTHHIICDSAPGHHDSQETLFRVWKETAEPSNSVTPLLQFSDQLWWILALLILFVLVVLCFLLRKRIFRCFRVQSAG